MTTECTECGKKIPAGQVHEINNYPFCRECCEKITSRQLRQDRTVSPEIYERVQDPYTTRVTGYRKRKHET